MSIESTHHFRYGRWTTDAAGLPCFDLRLSGLPAVDGPFRHLMGTGHLSAFADRWGNVNLFTTEGGFQWFNSPENGFARSSLGVVARSGDGEVVSLFYSELPVKGAIRYGIGYVEYAGEVKIGCGQFSLRQRIFCSPGREKFFQADFRLDRLDDGASLPLRLEFRSDVTAWENGPVEFIGEDGSAIFRQEDRQVFLSAGESWETSRFFSNLRVARDFTATASAGLRVGCAFGYGEIPEMRPAFEKTQEQWVRRLAPFRVEAPAAWMEEECHWNAGQLLSFCAFDDSVGEYYLSLGGYGWPGFSVREVSETSLILAECDWNLAAAALRFVAKTQLASGDVPKYHNMRRDRISEEFDSDNELWFVLGCAESVLEAGEPGLLDQDCPFWDGGTATMWEHLRRAFYWVRDSIGRGAHGLVLIREGDWNDYLSLMGAQGRGESVMNSGLACRAFDRLALLARQRGENAFAREIERYVCEVRSAVETAFVGGWFLRGYTDAGRAVGSIADDRLFINAQSWPVLGGCGTPAQRRGALREALARCHTRIGLTLVSRPFGSPAPDDISRCAIPPGEGENAGIWPQTIYWMVWALAAEGMIDEAWEEWACGTLRNHARQFPLVPFGIFNGPDCYSSKWAGEREGWSQVQLLDRARFVPMNPAIAWQGFALRKISRASLPPAAKTPALASV